MLLEDTLLPAGPCRPRDARESVPRASRARSLRREVYAPRRDRRRGPAVPRVRRPQTTRIVPDPAGAEDNKLWRCSSSIPREAIGVPPRAQALRRRRQAARRSAGVTHGAHPRTSTDFGQTCLRSVAVGYGRAPTTSPRPRGSHRRGPCQQASACGSPAPRNAYNHCDRRGRLPTARRCRARPARSSSPSLSPRRRACPT